MKKLKMILPVLICFAVLNFNVFAENQDDLLKERLLSYGMYSMVDIDGSVEIEPDISELSYNEIHEYVENQIIEKVSEFNTGNIIWDPSFVLELVPLEFPEFSDILYQQLMEQGYNEETNVVGEFEIEKPAVSLYTQSYTPVVSYSYNATGHGTVLTCESTIRFSVGDGIFDISSLSAKFTGGWSQLNSTTSIRNDNTANAYGFFNYTTQKDAYSYQANVQLKVVPTKGGNATLTVLSKMINSIGIGFNDENNQ